MPPRKRVPAGGPEHSESCAKARPNELFTATCPDGTDVRVERCLDCGAQELTPTAK